MAEWFGKTARPAILAASRSARLRHAAERMPLTRQVVRRFVPGESQDDVLGASTGLLDSGRFISIDYLGEDTTDSEQATRTVSAYLSLLDALAQRSVPCTPACARWRSRSSCPRWDRRCRATGSASLWRMHSCCAPRRIKLECG